MEHQKAIFDLLSSTFLFRGLKIDDLQEFAAKTKLLTFHKGQAILEEEMVNDKIYLILDGLVKVYKLTLEGKEIFLAVEKANDYVGIHHVESRPSSATVEALKTTKTLMFEKKDLIRLLEQHPLLWQKLYAVIVAKLEEYRELQSIRLGNTLYKRTYLLLRFLSTLFPDKTIPLSQEVIANIVGATRPRVNEILHLLRNEHIIRLSPKKITYLAET